MGEERQITEGMLRGYFGIPAGTAAPEGFSRYLARTDTRHRGPTAGEVEEYVQMVLQRMTRRGARRTAEENLQAFEKGWRENLDALLAGGLSDEALRPRYFRDSKFLRYQRGLIVSGNPQLEYDLLVLARYLVFAQYLGAADHIYELGCGSCGNLLFLSRMFPGKQLHGMDWTQASVDIATCMREDHGLRCDGRRLDMTNPPEDLELSPNSAVLTVHAMEQLGSEHGRLLATLMRSRPRVVVQFEPVLEFYEPENVYDQLALLYSKERNYLSGYLPALQKLAAAGDVEILAAVRPGVGGIIHESSLLVWRPC